MNQEKKKNKYPRINYRINYCSNEDPEYPSAELLLQSPESKGWQTTRYCSYPQTIILQFVQPMQLKQISVLNHQHKITSRIQLEFKLEKQKDFRRLGHFSISNESDNPSIRILKNIQVDVTCMFLKFVFMKNHINKHNLFNQIGLISICAYGQRLVSPKINTELNYHREQTQNYSQKQQVSQFDKNTMKKLRELEIMKKEAVDNEDYQQAGILKIQIDNIRKVGAYLSQLQQRKRIAVAREDYDSAKTIQEQIKKIRQSNGGGPNVSMQPSNHNIIPKQPLKKKLITQNNQNTQKNQYNQELESISPVTRVSQREQKRKNQSSRNQFVHLQPLPPQLKKSNNETSMKQNNKIMYNNDDMPIGKRSDNNKSTINKAYGNDQVPIVIKNSDPYGMNELKNQELNEQNEQQKQIQKPQNLKGEQAKLADSFSDVFDEEIFKQIFSKVYQNREAGLEQIKDIIEKPTKMDKNRLILATLTIIKQTMEDKIGSVILSSLDLFDRLLKKFKPNNPQNTGTLQYIMIKLSDYQGHTNQKVKLCSYQLFSTCPKYGMTNKNICLKSLITHIGKKSPSPKMISGRLDMIKKIIEEFKIGDNFQDIVQYTVKYVDDKNGEVRNSAMTLIKLLIDEFGYNKIAPFLKNIRAPILKSIQNMADPQQNSNPRKFQSRNTNVQQNVIITTNINPQGNNKKQSKIPQQRKKNQQKKAKNPEEYCDFCDKYDPQFQDQNYRDIHLFNACPMLILCQCKQAIEVSNYTSHLLTECQNKQNYKKCPRCFEAIQQKNYNSHIKAKQCIPGKSSNQANRCPLCHEDIQSGPQGWKKHLSNEGCPNHARG